MESTDRQLKDIELRSEKVRKLLSGIPKSLEYWGIAIIMIILIALILALYLLPYPYSTGESIIRHFLSF